LPFDVKRCAGEKLPDEAISAAAPALAKKRRAARMKKVGDLMTGARGRIRLRVCGSTSPPASWPIRNATSVSIFQELQTRYPRRFPDVQVRTLQRGLGKVRKHIILQFDDHWMETEVINGQSPAPVLRAVAVSAAP
jgi:hypothetical protein